MSTNYSNISRRNLLKFSAATLLVNTGLLNITACSKQEPLLRVASNVWPGYEFFYLAREKKYFSTEKIKLIEVPSATICIQSLAAGTIEGAMLTLDEVLTAKSEGLELKVIAVLDISMGADVVIAHPKIKNLSGLKGKKIGVEQSAVGAVMLDALLEKAKLNINDLTISYLTVNKHYQAYIDGQVDAVVTFEPVRTQLLNKGAIQLFDSSSVPGRIIDVLAVLPHVLDTNPEGLKKLIQGHFKAQKYYLSAKKEASIILSKRLQLNPSEVASSYEGLVLPDLQANHDWLDGSPSKLEKSARELKTVMLHAKLMKTDISIDDLITNRFI